jgi:hypothetical protein
MQNKGVKWANRVLKDNESKLNEQIANQLSQQQTSNSAPARNSEDYGFFWKIYSNFTNAYGEQSPLAFQSGQWRTFCLERQVAGWVDELLATDSKDIKPDQTDTNNNGTSSDNVDNNKKGNAANSGTISSSIRRFGMNSWRTSSNFNYLEPTADLYRKMADGQTTFENSLNQLALFPTDSLEQSHDFVRLARRLAGIAKKELDNETLTAEDQSLLASIDKLLQVIESPLVNNLFVNLKNNDSDALADNLFSNQPGQNVKTQGKSSPSAINSSIIKLTDDSSNKKQNSHGNILKQIEYAGALAGVNMSLGLPATVYLILEYKRAYYLLRGAVYSYYEQCGEQINEKHWQRQVEFGLLEAPFWCQSFQRSNPRSN